MAVEFKDYYRILGVDRNADDKTINEAYEVLSDPEKRRRYDTLGPDWERYAHQPSGPGSQQGGGFTVEYGDAGDFSEFFRSIFGDLGGRRIIDTQGGGGGFEDLIGGRFGRASRRRRGEDIQAGVEISLEEAFNGTRKSLALEVDEPCATCHGSGNVDGKPCATCQGTGWQRVRREVDVKIPAGVRTGQRVRVSGEGGGGAGGRGDLYLVVSVAPHPQFERKGDDLHLTLPITAPEAALGSTIEVPTLRGKVSMKIPPATSSHRTFRLPGYGMPRLKGGGAGDELVTVRIVMPAELTAAEKELYERLRALRTDSPRGYAQG